MCRIVLLTFFLVVLCPAAGLRAQDSVAVLTHADSADVLTHRLRPRTVAVAASLTAVSAVAVDNGWLRIRKGRFHDRVSAHGKKFLRADDYVQYAGIVAAYGLDLAGVRAAHSMGQRTVILGVSWAAMGILVNGMKYTFREKRPDSNARNSFPSGHTATAFMGAELLFQEYRDTSPWIGWSAYGLATVTGWLRIYNDRHYINDVVAGACIGVLSTKLAYWLYPRLFSRSECGKRRKAFMGAPFVGNGGAGVAVAYAF